ncbi:LAMI_0F10506g1_1 [Lachancea mirantina]|uniref:LAMI_0F10506g1_1 n=1 Tax=Lachancea mirantina TaxID=1230905 RepID=A0A1G4K230_9SACH|nr:LAMI_0F10506g1_1 [Lachancea mirantina]
MNDDDNYISPHETALAVVATAMKKARLGLDTLIVNSIMAGIFFSAGGILFVSFHGYCPLILEQNPGILLFAGSFAYPVGLFYVIINGTDLFNSNILFFTVGCLRQAVNIYDLLISWFVSWFGNFAGTLFVSYIIMYLSKVGRDSHYIHGSVILAEDKAVYNFIETFIKGMVGNFYVCLAIYLQLMAKPLHVRLILMALPIVTFVSGGFTHVVADMFILTSGMLNGADISIAKFVWRMMLPATLGNVVGGVAFAAVVPFYLHLLVVERDRKRLSLPRYDARDEQPDLNMDSRVVKISPEEAEEEQEAAECSAVDEKQSISPLGETSSSEDAAVSVCHGPIGARSMSHESHLSRSDTRSTLRRRVPISKRSPAGVFPVKGMGLPLQKEMTIADDNASIGSGSTFSVSKEPYRGPEPFTAGSSMENDVIPVESSNSRAQRILTAPTGSEPHRTFRPHLPVRSNSFSQRGFNERRRGNSSHQGGYDVNENKLGTKLERALTRLASRVSSTQEEESSLPQTTQDVVPRTTSRVNPHETPSSVSLPRPAPAKKRSTHGRKLIESLSRSNTRNNPEEFLKRMSSAGITTVAAEHANTTAGIEDLSYEDLRYERRHARDPKSKEGRTAT